MTRAAETPAGPRCRANVVKTGKVSLWVRCRSGTSHPTEPRVLAPPRKCDPVGRWRKRQSHTRRYQPSMERVVGRRSPKNRSMRRRIMRIPAGCWNRTAAVCHSIRTATASKSHFVDTTATNSLAGHRPGNYDVGIVVSWRTLVDESVQCSHWTWAKDRQRRPFSQKLASIAIPQAPERRRRWQQWGQL